MLATTETRRRDLDADLDAKENWPRLLALTSFPCVELPGIEPVALPGLLPSELPVRYITFPFSPVRYLRIHFRVLTASRSMLTRAAVCGAADAFSLGVVPQSASDTWVPSR